MTPESTDAAMGPTGSKPTVDRRPELDAIRTLVVVGLVFFHASLVFDESDDFYVKNHETTSVTTVIAGFAVLWAMPALFLIAGFGSWHSMARRGVGGFTRERLRRLGVPLLFAILTFLPVPVWLRLKAADPAYHESYLAFLPKFYTVHPDLRDFPFVLRGDYFETGHLWFVVLLLTFSLLLALAARLRLPTGAVARAVAGRRGVVLLPALATSAICAWIGMDEAFAGWSRWAYLLFFLCGFLLASDERFRLAMRRDGVLAAVLGVAVFAVTGPVLLTAGDDPFTAMTTHAIIARALFGFAGWCVVVAILGLLDRRNARTTAGPGRVPSRAYRYLAVAALPLYVLHQPIVVAVAYGVVRWDAPIPVKYVAIVVPSLALTVAAYEFLVRRTRITRYLFGMRT